MSKDTNIDSSRNAKIYDILNRLDQAVGGQFGISLTSSSGYSTSYSTRWIGSLHYWMREFPEPALFIGSPEQCRLATILKVIDKTCVATVNPSLLTTKEAKKIIEEYKDVAPLLYDVTADDSQFGEREVPGYYGRTYMMPSYTGEIDPAFALPYAKAGFVAAMNDCWQKEFLMDRQGRHNALRTIGRSKALARGLTLDKIEIYLPSGRGTGAKISNSDVSFLNACSIKVESEDKRVVSAMKCMSTTRDYALLWQKQADDRNMSIRIAEHTLNDSDETLKIFKGAAEILDMEEVVKAYELGVPAQDIVA